MARAKTFDARAVLLQKTFTANKDMIAEVRDVLRKVKLGSMSDSGALMQSLLDNVSRPLEQALARHATWPS